eukprot:6184637-Pleurochrysis_carterae.AAC.6
MSYAYVSCVACAARRPASVGGSCVGQRRERADAAAYKAPVETGAVAACASYTGMDRLSNGGAGCVWVGVGVTAASQANRQIEGARRQASSAERQLQWQAEPARHRLRGAMMRRS